MKYTIKKDKLSKIIYLYKTLSGFNIYDRVWDRIHWARASKTGKVILQVFQEDIPSIVRCFKWCVEYFNKNNLTWTIETVLRWVPNYLKYVDSLTKKLSQEETIKQRTILYRSRYERNRNIS